MANTFTPDNLVNPSTVCGNLRMVVGVLDMGDGNGGLAAQCGLDKFAGGTLTPKSAANASALTFVSGGIKAGTASSGDSFHVVAFGT